MSKLVSIGYGGRRGVEELIAPLQQASVRVLADIRISPRGRLVAFNKNNLAMSCDASGITYVHLSALGNVNRDGRMGPLPILANESTGIDQLAVLLRESEAVAIMCACRKQAGCHRELVIQKILHRLSGVDLVTVP